MNYLVKTNGDPLNVRQAANGEIVGTVANGTIITTVGKAISLAGNSWIEIKPIANIPSDRQWVASKYLVAVASSQNFHPNKPTDNPPIKKAKIIATSSKETIGGGLRVYYAQLIDETGNIIDT
ncbi:MAG: hypothetical protein ACRC2J_00165, partial [Microcoleaceae cyanobacterium]